MKKLIPLLAIGCLLCLVACQPKKESPYNRTDNTQNYEQFIRSHVFAACLNDGQPYATYSLAKVNKRPSKDNDYYKVTFTNGPCEGQVRWTKSVILKTEPVGAETPPTGTVLLRNYWNPKDPYNQEQTGRWNIGVVTNNSRVEKGIIDLAFPRDRNDFSPAREGIYLHNTRYIVTPQIKDVRQFIH